MEREENIVVEYAGFWRRLAAFLVDGLVILSCNWVLIAPWRWIFSVLFPWKPGVWPGSFPFHDPFAGVTILIGVVYFVLFWVWRGQTAGMMVMNIKVLKEDGTAVTPSTAIIRYVGYIVCILTLGIGFLALGFDERRQGLHDKMALTVVVKLPPVKLRLPEATTG
ncbi:MAG: RDD family protein [Dehalococcoidaceae bacterium]|nr:RDD family protein [Dehalococcoidaceae bacterium]